MAKLESDYSFMLKHSKITVWKYKQQVATLHGFWFLEKNMLGQIQLLEFTRIV